MKTSKFAAYSLSALLALSPVRIGAPSATFVSVSAIESVTTRTFDCAQCSDQIFGDNVSHQFGSGGAYFDCVVFNSCHTDFQTGYCSTWHCGCNAEMCGLMQDILQVSLGVGVPSKAEIVDNARIAGATVVKGYLAKHSDYLKYNSDRGVIQVVGCGGRIQAQFAVNAKAAAELAGSSN